MDWAYVCGPLVEIVVDCGAVKMSPDDGGGFFSLAVRKVVIWRAVIVFYTVSLAIIIIIIIIIFIVTRVSFLSGQNLEAIVDEIPCSRHGRMHQVPGRQSADILGSVLHDGMNANFKAEGVEYGEHGEVNAFEGAGDGFPTAILRVRVLMVAEEAENTTLKMTVSMMRSMKQ